MAKTWAQGRCSNCFCFTSSGCLKSYAKSCRCESVTWAAQTVVNRSSTPRVLMSSPHQLCSYASEHTTRGRFGGVAASQPALQSAGEWSHVRDSLPFECERHTVSG